MWSNVVATMYFINKFMSIFIFFHTTLDLKKSKNDVSTHILMFTISYTARDYKTAKNCNSINRKDFDFERSRFRKLRKALC